MIFPNVTPKLVHHQDTGHELVNEVSVAGIATLVKTLETLLSLTERHRMIFLTLKWIGQTLDGLDQLDQIKAVLDGLVTIWPSSLVHIKSVQCPITR
jgi:hypothetical protein